MRWDLAVLLVVAALALLNTPLPAWGANFGEDVEFMKKYFPDLVVLKDATGQAQVAVTGALQGRVMTSSARGQGGASFGWINRELIASGKKLPHMNAFGGEDRFWIGPEGGQFSIYFAKGDPFDFAHWQTPAVIDTIPFEAVKTGDQSAAYRLTFQLNNYSGNKLDVRVDREVRLIQAEDAWKRLAVAVPAGVQTVAYESVNRMTNVGNAAWTKQTGQLSVWILGMYNPGEHTTIVIPIKPGNEADLGPRVNSDYFGPVPPERLVAKEKTVFFSGDGKMRTKIGINPKRCTGLAGSYDADQKALTIVQFTVPQGKADYVNSAWKIQDDPFSGDAANSYNDGPTPTGKPLGPFYELESSSPAAALAPGATLEHVHRTIHAQGPEAALDVIAQAVLGVSLKEITTALPLK